jgi:hypothetical protein
MLAHNMDPPGLYPYKRAHMQKLFAAFREMLERKSVRARSPYQIEFLGSRGYRPMPGKSPANTRS